MHFVTPGNWSTVANACTTQVFFHWAWEWIKSFLDKTSATALQSYLLHGRLWPYHFTSGDLSFLICTMDGWVLSFLRAKNEALSSFVKDNPWMYGDVMCGSCWWGNQCPWLLHLMPCGTLEESARIASDLRPSRDPPMALISVGRNVAVASLCFFLENNLGPER